MFEKIKLFVKKNGLYICLGLVLIISVFAIAFSFFHKKTLDVVVKKTDKIVNKINDQIVETKIRQNEIQIEKNIKLQVNDAQKIDLQQKIQSIQAVSDREERLKKLIELNQSIKVVL